MKPAADKAASTSGEDTYSRRGTRARARNSVTSPAISPAVGAVPSSGIA